MKFKAAQSIGLMLASENEIEAMMTRKQQP